MDIMFTSEWNIRMIITKSLGDYWIEREASLLCKFCLRIYKILHKLYVCLWSMILSVMLAYNINCQLLLCVLENSKLILEWQSLFSFRQKQLQVNQKQHFSI